jgi:class 3 adenylate cyclase
MERGADSIFNFSHHDGAILVVDVVESVRLMEEDEAGYIQRWRAFLVTALGDVLPALGGRFHKSTGDGCLLRFPDADRAVRAALDLQHLCAAGQAELPEPRRIRLRMAAHLADYVEDEFDVYGAGVNVAVRLLDLAQAGDVVVSAGLRHRLSGGLALQDLGPRALRHVREPVHAWRVLPRWGLQVPGHASAAEDLQPQAPRDPRDAV